MGFSVHSWRMCLFVQILVTCSSTCPMMLADKIRFEQAQELVNELGYLANSNEGRLIIAVFVNDTAEVGNLIKSGVNFNFKPEDMQLPLLNAIDRGNDIIVKLLLNTKKFDPNLPDEEGYTPLLIAAAVAGGPQGTQGHVNIVKLLLNAGADPNSVFKGDIGKTFKDLLRIDPKDRIEEKQRKLSLQKIVTDFEALQTPQQREALKRVSQKAFAAGMEQAKQKKWLKQAEHLAPAVAKYLGPTNAASSSESETKQVASQFPGQPVVTVPVAPPLGSVAPSGRLSVKVNAVERPKTPESLLQEAMLARRGVIGEESFSSGTSSQTTEFIQPVPMRPGAQQVSTAMEQGHMPARQRGGREGLLKQIKEGVQLRKTPSPNPEEKYQMIPLIEQRPTEEYWSTSR